MTKPGYTRKYPRRQFNHKVGVLCAGDYFCVQGLEIGEGGFGFESDMSIPPERELVLTFQVPDGDFIFVRAEIKSHKMMSGVIRYGVTFKNLKFESKRQIRAFVSNRPETEEAIRH